MTAELELHFPGARRSYVVPVGRAVIAGKSGTCDLCLGEYLAEEFLPVISRRHFRIAYRRPDGYTIEDLDSRNGTAVNSRPLEPGEWRFLRYGDVITLAGDPACAIEVRLEQEGDTVVIARTAPVRPVPCATGLRFAADIDQFSLDGRPLPHSYLTELEHSLLRYLVLHAGRVCTFDALISNVWGYRYEETGDNTVAKTVSNLRRKLDGVAEGAGERHIITVRGRGFECVLDAP